MFSITTLTKKDLRDALLRGVKLTDVEKAIIARLKLPSSQKSSSSPLFLLRHSTPELATIVCQWMDGCFTQPSGAPSRIAKTVLVPFSKTGIRTSAYLKPLITKFKPKAIVVDASSGTIGAALHYGFSIFCALKIAVRVCLVRGETLYEENFFQPGDFLPELAAFCFRTNMPLIPIASRPRLVPSEHQHMYNQLVATANKHFSQEADKKPPVPELEQTAVQLMQDVLNAGPGFELERENLITESCYLASRLRDLFGTAAFKRYARSPILVLYELPHALDFPPLLKTLLKDNAVIEELYLVPEPGVDGNFHMAVSEASEAPGAENALDGPEGDLAKALDKWLVARMQEKLSMEEVDQLAAGIAEATRQHPLIARPGGVRGTLASREIAQAYGLIRGNITRKTLAEATHLALVHRNYPKPGEEASIDEILKGIISRVIYDVPLYAAEEEKPAGPARPLSPEELTRALMGLSDAAMRHIPPGEGLPIDDPAFAEEVMNHPLVQQALQDAMAKGFLDNIQQSYSDLLKELEDRGCLDLLNDSEMTLSEDGQKKLRKSLEEALARGDITPEDFANALNNAKALPAPPGMQTEKMFASPQAATELLAELMDFQHQGRSQNSSLEDLYVHYTLKENKGLDVSAEKVDYEKLKILIHDLEKRGMIKLSDGRKRFSLSSVTLEKLLEGLIRRQEGQILEQRAFRREHEIDRTEVRRFRKGDVFRDISIRHSLRRVVRKGKALEDINHSDFRSYEKKPSNQLDIVICLDVSASMKDSAKLRYAKMAVAELARAAIAKHDRVGVVSFSNVGQVVVPLTDKLSQILEAVMTMRAEQYTNIGNGLVCARRMLLKSKNSNPKYIVLISDGQPNAALFEDQPETIHPSRVAAYSRETSMERKEMMGTQHALIEAGKTSRKNIKISVVFITQEDEQGEKLAREVARIGRGKFHKVRAMERLPLEALVTVG